mgnify:CR=1 FL=1
MSYIKEKVAYLNGLAAGLGLSDDAHGKLIGEIISVLDSMADAVDENDAAIIDVNDCLEDVCEELDDIEEYLFDDEDDDDDDEFIEFTCPSCGDTVCFTDDMLESGNELICPNCNAVVVPASEKEE